MLKKISLVLMVVFYAVAGLNHFIHPTFYYPLIPAYIGHQELLNVTSGIIELVFAFGLLLPKTRRFSALGIIAMLIAFIPSHIYFIKLDGCVQGGLCTGPAVAWFRLVLIHPLLIGWAFWHTRG